VKALLKFINSISFKTWLKIFVLVPVTFIVIFFISRSFILHKIVNSKTEGYRINKKVDISFGEISFVGISGIKASNLIVAPIGKDTLLQAQNIYLHVRLLPLFLGHLRIDEIQVDNVKINVYEQDSINNYSFLIRKNRKTDSSEVSSNNINIAETADHLFDNIFDNIPNSISIKKTQVFANIDSAKVSWQIPIIVLKDGLLHSNALITESNSVVDWTISATINKSERKLKLKLFHASNYKASLPFLMSKFNMKCGFDTLTASIDESDFEDGKFYVSGKASINNVVANHWRIAPTDVVIKTAALKYKLFFGEDDLGLDSSTTCQLNDIVVYPYLSYKIRPNKTFALDIKMPSSDANNFFSSLPKGLFSSLEGIKAKGELAYNLHFYIDTQLPDSLQFTSSIIPHNLKITNYGQVNLAKMNDEFLYTAYEGNTPVATFPVGPSNPDFVALQNISPYLRNAVLVSEDGDFFWHKGFNENAFRKSIATNFKEKKFKRGGSTISMQLVKNVFLTRKKNVARKLEEALIVWLIENNRITSKDRMYEVYLNVIEWGPGVFGAAEAAQYYFNKKCTELTIAESIFLAMIVPNPKRFYWQFDDAGALKKHTASFFSRVATHLVRREIITEDDKITLIPSVNIVGIAKQELKLKSDTIPIDSLQIMLDIE